MVRTTILYDNTVARKDLESDWGFSVLIETPERMVLFDAGGDGHILLENARILGIDLSFVDTIFISHNHFDHTGGLASAIRACPSATIYLPPSLKGVKRGFKRLHVKEAMDMGNGLVSTGELASIEQSLYVPTDSGYLLVVGCSHPGLDMILREAPGRVHAILGGFHGFDRFETLEHVDFFCPTHCTRNAEQIRELYPERFLPGGVGMTYTFPLKEVR